MRLWSLHPQHLDRQGLTALWREGLLAQAVLAGRTRGYTRHPQLERFRATAHPGRALAAYLDEVRAEAGRRGYRFDPERIDDIPRDRTPIPVTEGQVELEWAHLLAKLAARSPDRYAAQHLSQPLTHPLLTVVPGPVEPWERLEASGRRAKSW
ncbi:pyrimidine dimer DNA glycosylase/endonuclease V [Ornithinimicrobium panacihumi]|uniref:pyrimidine dimer DNA glycosylase/endonuclease V n=1 Tax=Ornithinimicrobium panacihumi TaxID=2008449 RepID=UPI003F8A4019